MESLIIALIIMAIIHYIYDQILLPNKRLVIRSEIFELRDELRAELVNLDSSQDSYKENLAAFKKVDDSINRAINRLHLLTLSNMFKAIKGTTDRDVARIKNVHALLDRAQSTVPREVYAKVNRKLETTLFVNSLLFIMYLLPLILAGTMLALVVSRGMKFVNMLKSQIHQKVEVIQNGDGNKFA